MAAWARRAGAQPKTTITYWNGLTGADGKVMDELIDQFTRDSGIRIEQQRLPWADLYAKLQVAVPAGEGPDLALIHTVEVPHFASDGVLEVIDDATAAAKGFRGEDYLPAMWQGGTFQGKRYSLPLDVPQHILYMNVKVMKDAGLTGSDGRPRVPAEPRRAGDHGQAHRGQGRHLRLRDRHREPGPLHLGLPQPALAERGQRLHRGSQARGVTDPAALEVAEFWAALEGQHKIAPPANANCRDAFIAGKLGMWIAGSWNFTGLREAKVEFMAVPVPRLFKQAVVWAMPHQYTFPKPKAADRAKRDAAWAHVRWMTDHVAEWTLKAGQVSASRKAHSDPRVTADPVLRALLSQAAELAGRPAHPQVGRGREPDPPGDRGGLHRPEARARPRWRIWPARSTRCPTSVSRQTRVAYAFLAPGLLLFAAYRLYPLLEGLRLSFTNARLGRPDPAVGRARQLRPPARGHPLPGEPLEHRVLHGGQHAADPRGAARAGGQ